MENPNKVKANNNTGFNNNKHLSQIVDSKKEDLSNDLNSPGVISKNTDAMQSERRKEEGPEQKSPNQPRGILPSEKANPEIINSRGYTIDIESGKLMINLPNNKIDINKLASESSIIDSSEKGKNYEISEIRGLTTGPDRYKTKINVGSGLLTRKGGLLEIYKGIMSMYATYKLMEKSTDGQMKKDHDTRDRALRFNKEIISKTGNSKIGALSEFENIEEIVKFVNEDIGTDWDGEPVEGREKYIFTEEDITKYL